jgi:hypothetical protein
MHSVATWRGRVGRAIFVCLLGLVGAAGCTMIGDSVTGVSLTQQAIGDCISACAHAASDEMQTEQSLHQDNVDRCLELSEPDKGPCLNAEGARHSAAVQEIADRRRECQGGCHHQGSGSAG